MTATLARTDSQKSPSYLIEWFGSVGLLWFGLAFFFSGVVGAASTYSLLNGLMTGAANIASLGLTLFGSVIVLMVCIAYFAVILNQMFWLDLTKKS